VRAPGLLARVELDGEIGLWLEDAGPAPGWSVDRLATAGWKPSYVLTARVSNTRL